MGQVFGAEKFKCVMIGESGVGKTSLVNLWRLKPLPEVYCPTAGIVQHDVYFKVLIYESPIKYRRIRLNLQDVSSDATESEMDLSLKGADVVVMMYDVAKKDTLDYLDYVWPKLLRQTKGSALFVLVGIKNDNSVMRRSPTRPVLMPRKREFNVANANITSLAYEKSANVRSLCYQILKKAYAQRHKDLGCSYEFLFDADKNKPVSNQNSCEQVTEDGFVRTFRNQEGPSF